jgi:hypothetical protein
MEEEDFCQYFYDTLSFSQNYWGFGLCPSTNILTTRKHVSDETSSVDWNQLVLPEEGHRIQSPKRRVFK